MDIKQLKYFVSVVEEGSLSAAAKHHGVTVQALSKSMSNLEQDFSDLLFTRDHNGIHLTVFGMEFYARARTVVTSFEELESSPQEFFCQTAPQSELPRLQLFVCIPTFSLHSAAKKRAQVFLESCLGLKVDITVGAGQEGIKHLAVGAYDALVTIGEFIHPDFDCLSMGTISPCVCLAKNHPLAQKKEVTLEELAPYTVLTSSVFDRFNESIFVTYQKHGIKSPVAENGFFETTSMFYLEHAYIFMANIPILGEMLPLSLTVPFAHSDSIPIPLCLIVPKNTHSESLARLKNLLRSRPMNGSA